MSKKHNRIKGIQSTIVAVLLILWGCKTETGNNRRAEQPLLPGIAINDTQCESVCASKILNEWRFVPLELCDSSTIGLSYKFKVLKRNSMFYVQSFNDVVIFNNEGEFMGKLSKTGGGPDEYAEMLDFDVVQTGGHNEIMVGAPDGIYRYELPSLRYIGKIVYDGYVSQLKFVNDSTIIIETPGDTRFKAINMSGGIRKSYFPDDGVNNCRNPIGFHKCQKMVFFQLVKSNDAIAFNLTTDDFNISPIFSPDNRYQTSALNMEYADRYNNPIEAFRQIDKNYIGINAIQCLDGQVIATTSLPGKGNAITFHANGTTLTCLYGIATSEGFINDISNEYDGWLLPNGLLACDSDDSFLFLIPSQREGDGGEEDNPWLLEVKRLTL